MIHKSLRFGLRSLALVVLLLAVFFWWMNEPDRVVTRFVNALSQGDLDKANSMLGETSRFVTDSDSVYLRTGIGTDYEYDTPWVSEHESLDQNTKQLACDIAGAVLVKEPCTLEDWFKRQRAFYFSSRYLYETPAGYIMVDSGSGPVREPYWDDPNDAGPYMVRGENDSRFGRNGFRVIDNQIEIVEQ